MAGTDGRWQALVHSLPVRAWARYSRFNGGTLAGGAAYFAFFAVFPAIGVGATAAGLILRDRPDLQARLARSVNEALNTPLISVGPDQGLLDVQSLTGGRLLVTTALVAAVGLVLAGLGWLGAVRAGVSAMFGGRFPPINPVLAVLRDLLLLATVGAAVLGSVVAGVAVTALSQRTADWLGLDGSGPAALALRIAAVALLTLVDIGLLLTFMRLLSGVRLPVRDLVGGAVAGGVATGLLRLGGGLLLARMSSNHALAAVSSVVLGLLLWFNLLARVSLLAASIAATVAIDRGHLRPEPEFEPASELEPEYAPAPAPALPPRLVVVPAPAPSFGPRSQDRVAIAAGAVLGAGTVVAGRVVARGGRAAAELLTGRRRSGAASARAADRPRPGQPDRTQ
jgi:membrane protein